ncbi:MAG: hypothetical protein Q9217_001759 [Psora testacea]
MSETKMVKRETLTASSPGSSKKRNHVSHGDSRLLQRLESNLSDIRELITCRVCVRPLYEPYTTECGHTFCYGCLVRWFEQDCTKKSCPDCRAIVARQPAPAYVIRDLTQIFSNRVELLPAGETTLEHNQWQEEEKQKVESDRMSYSGLFNGIFRIQILSPFIRDDQDGVVRCPRCTWELEDGACGSCGWGSPSYTDESLSMEDDDYDESVPGWPDHENNIIDLGEEGGLMNLDGPSTYPAASVHFHEGHRLRPSIPTYDSFLEDSEGDDDGDDDSAGSLDQFIVNDEGRDRSAVREIISPVSDSEGDISDTVHTIDSDEDHRSREETESAFSDQGFSHGTGRYQDADTDSEPVQPPGRRRPWETNNAENPSQTRRQDQSPFRDTSVLPRPIHHRRRNPRPLSSRPTQASNAAVTLLHSDSEDSVIPIQHPRRRPRLRHQITSDDDEEPQFDGSSSGKDHEGYSSGTATVGRRSQQSLFPHGQPPLDSSAAAPIVIDSSPTRPNFIDIQHERQQSIPGAFPQSFSNTEPSQSGRQTLTSPSPSESSQFHYTSPPSPNHGQRAREFYPRPSARLSLRPSDLDPTSQHHGDTTLRHLRNEPNHRLFPPRSLERHRTSHVRSSPSSHASRSPHQLQRPGTEASSAQAAARMRGEAREAKRRRQKSERRRRELVTSNEGRSNRRGNSSGAGRLQAIEL